jgi:hypothetical protein
MALENRLDIVNIANRRGLLLGLTLSEIMMIILFALLLLFGAVFSEQDEDKKRIAELDNAARRGETALAAVDRMRDLIVQAGIATNKIDDVLREMKLVEHLRNEIKRLKDQQTALVPVNSIEKRKQLDTVLEELRKNELEVVEAQNKLDQILREMTQVADKRKEVEKRATEFEKEVMKLKDEVSRQKGQIVQMRRELSGVGKGTEMPACWADEKTGKTEYIFDVALLDGGFIVHDNKLPHRISQQSELPLNGMSYDVKITSRQFIGESKALFEWSLRNECRFFVRMFDDTNNKGMFKEQIQVLQSIYYTLWINNEKYPHSQVSTTKMTVGRLGVQDKISSGTVGTSGSIDENNITHTHGKSVQNEETKPESLDGTNDIGDNIFGSIGDSLKKVFSIFGGEK